MPNNELHCDEHLEVQVHISESDIDDALTDDDLVADAIGEMKLLIDDLNAKGNEIYNFLHSTKSDDLAHELRECGRSFVKHRLIKEHPANRG